MQKVIDYCKQYIGVISIVLAVCILLTYTFSHFIVTSDNHRSAEMYIGELKYSITIDGSNVNTINVPSGETIIDLSINSLNDVSTYFKLIYESNSNVTISYFKETKDTSDAVTTYLASGDLIDTKGSGNLKIKIVNTSYSNQNVVFKATGGYSTNTLADIDVPSGYSEINKEPDSTNTYFCKTNDTLTQGLVFVDRQYTYRYKQSVLKRTSSSSGSGSGSGSSSGGTPTVRVVTTTSNQDFDGWSIDLTDYTSGDPITTKQCTYINNKPILEMNFLFYYSASNVIDLSSFDTHNVESMANMFANSSVTTLDLSSFDTHNVYSMYGMFRSSQATNINLSSFDTSKVRYMSYMFYGSKVTSLDLNGFDTGKVTNMSYMFRSSKVTSLDLSSFNTSSVADMSNMFESSQTTSLDLSNFDTSKVTNMSSMFYNSNATTIDVSNFDTSNVTDMTSMFAGGKAVSLDLSSFDTSKVTNMSYMFYNGAVKTIYVSNKFVTDKVTSSSYMFTNASNLVGGNGTAYNSSYVDKTYARIDTASIPGYFTLKG